MNLIKESQIYYISLRVVINCFKGALGPGCIVIWSTSLSIYLLGNPPQNPVDLLHFQYNGVLHTSAVQNFEIIRCSFFMILFV
ncbi:unnamed protein product [Moneuplotes crassus]|uniref:Uncharacterized protein n=1 Tax=Euplotes crassus TaxID=5936 RepID=A0AAD1Y4V8_EUPCR|nr:unnamed protein product [Moneuplotes crassus]